MNTIIICVAAGIVLPLVLSYWSESRKRRRGELIIGDFFKAAIKKTKYGTYIGFSWITLLAMSALGTFRMRLHSDGADNPPLFLSLAAILGGLWILFVILTVSERLKARRMARQAYDEQVGAARKVA